MKRGVWVPWLLVAALALQLVFPGMVGAEIKDVKPDHWAYHAVATLVSKGYLAVYEDGTFQGDRSVDRYTLAVTLARILDDIEAGRVQSSVDDMALLKELTTEFREELVDWYGKQEAVAERLQSAEDAALAAEDRMSRVTAAQMEMQEEVAALREELLVAAENARLLESYGEQLRHQEQELAEQSESLEALAHQLRKEAERIREQDDLGDQQDSRLLEHAEQLEQLHDSTSYLQESLQKQTATVERLENWIGEKDVVFAALQAEDRRLAGLIEDVDQATQAIERQMLAFEAVQEEESEDILAELAQSSSELEARIDQLTQALTEADAQLLAEIENIRQRMDQDREAAAALADEVGAVQTGLAETRIELFDTQAKLQDTQADLTTALNEINELAEVSGQLERDLVRLSVSIRNEAEARTEATEAVDDKLLAFEREINELLGEMGISDAEWERLSQQVSDEVSVEMASALHREQRLERKLEELEQDFTEYKAAMESQQDTLRNTTTIALVVGGLSLIYGLVSGQ